MAVDWSEMASIPTAPPGFRSGFVGIIGRPNVGKSTLMNYLVGQKIAITSPIAQTTRNRLRGILTTPAAQIIFVDTPGIHKPHHQLGQVIVKNAQTAIHAVDVLLLVVDGSVAAGGGDRYIIDLLANCQIPVILGINKADQQTDQQNEPALVTAPPIDQAAISPPPLDAADPLVTPEFATLTMAVEPVAEPIAPARSAATEVEEPGATETEKPEKTWRPTHWIDRTYRDLVAERNWPIAKFSALTGAGVAALQQALIEQLDPGPYYYPPDLVTDQPERFIMGELIREQILVLTREEVPHSVAIVIEKVTEAATITRVMAVINVERPSQKGIIIGKGGVMLKEIGKAARTQIQKLIAGKVHLELFVKVQPKWRQSRTRLAELGYRIEE
jgi:GTPase